jgi:hypothetical protein
MREPFRDEALFAQLRLLAGQRVTVTVALETALAQEDKPVTLFGFRDHFADNWNNWKWPFVHSEHYAKYAARLRPFHGQLAFARAAGATRIALRSPAEKKWLRSLSHEQHLAGSGEAGVHTWNFSADAQPRAVQFEYLPGLEIAEEARLFEKIASSRPADLRAHIRLADLYRMTGESDRRAAVLQHLLQIWSEHAAAQMMVGRNDLRGPAWVALVLTLEQLERVGKVKKALERGRAELTAMAGAARGKLTEANVLARGWLEHRVQGKKKDQ